DNPHTIDPHPNSGSVLSTSLLMEQLPTILTDRRLAQFGDSLLNFAYSLALTRETRKPIGVKVKDKVLANAAVSAGLRQYLPRRVNVGDVANSLEALVAEALLQEKLNLEEIVNCLTPQTLDPSEGFAKLGLLSLERLGIQTKK
ncbi:MAG TPA: ribonuclease III family protein, partial [Candidatus Binatus sp.]|nr:ribonuclease III family protein [Candidatus Binatus sp.]